MYTKIFDAAELSNRKSSPSTLLGLQCSQKDTGSMTNEDWSLNKWCYRTGNSLFKKLHMYMIFPTETPSLSPFAWYYIGVLQKHNTMIHGKKMPPAKSESTRISLFSCSPSHSYFFRVRGKETETIFSTCSNRTEYSKQDSLKTWKSLEQSACCLHV